MKGIKKLIISLLALVMVMGASMTAFAAGEGENTLGSGTITVEKAIAGQTYDAYRVFDYVPADAKNPDNGGVYKLNAEFASKGFANYVYSYKDADGKDATVNMSAFFKVGDGDILDTTGLGTVENPGDVATFGKAAIAFAKAKEIKPNGSGTAKIEGNVKAGDETTATISVNGYGYYAVDSSLGTAVAVDTTKPDVTINEKNSKPGLNKEITGATNTSTILQDKTGNNAQIGDTVEFTISAKLKVGGEKYAIVDVMDEGLTLSTKIDDLTVSFSDGVTMPYTKAAYTDPTTKRTGFKITFEGEPSKNTVATVKYEAIVNTNAKISPDENINEGYLIYGHDTETTHVETKTKTYPMILKKVIKGTDTVLAGAHFTIYRKSDASVIKFRKVSDTEYVVDPAGEETDIVTVASAPITLKGFNTETYVLEETQAPQGYNLLVAPNNATFTYKDANDKDVTTTHFKEAVVAENTTVENAYVETVENSSGLTLPSTGGIGTTIFYIIGGILIVAGVAYFIVRRKAAAK